MHRSFRTTSFLVLSAAAMYGTIDGDSIVLDVGPFGTQRVLLTYRRARQKPSPMPSDIYRLTSIDGRTGTPLVSSVS